MYLAKIDNDDPDRVRPPKRGNDERTGKKMIEIFNYYSILIGNNRNKNIFEIIVYDIVFVIKSL